MCKGKYWWQVGIGNKPWFYCDILQEKVEAIEIKHILDPEVVMETISARNIPSKGVQNKLKKKEIKKV